MTEERPARGKWRDEQEILQRYEQDMKRADELGLTKLSGTTLERPKARTK
jgi:hypothetical protein